MKKKFIILTIALLLGISAIIFLIVTCSKQEEATTNEMQMPLITPTPIHTPENTPTPTLTPEPTPQSAFDPDLPVSSENWPEHLPRHEPGSIQLNPNIQQEILWRFQPTVRWTMYVVQGELLDLFSLEEQIEVGEWWSSIFSTDLYPEIPPLVQFIQRYNISREDFDRAMNEFREIRDDLALRGIIDSTTEEFEIPNADIIYTFDLEIISYFYRRE